MRNVFFSFHFERDIWRVNQVRNCQIVPSVTPSGRFFLDPAGWESLKRQGDDAVRNWIARNMSGTSVTVVLIGADTSTRPWVKHEIKKSIQDGKGLLGVRIHALKNESGLSDSMGVNPLPPEYSIYSWHGNSDCAKLGDWIEQAAKDAGR